MKNKFAILIFIFLVGLLPFKVNANPNNNFSLAIRMAQARIDRFVTTPEEILVMERERNKGIWDSVELVNTRELDNGNIEYTLRLSVDQRTRIYTQDFANTIAGPKNITVTSLGIFGDINEDLSAYDAQRLLDQCKEWYANDPDYRRVVDIVEREVLTKLKYDWVTFLSGGQRSYQESIRIGLGICDVYARLTKEVLTKAGFKVELWTGPHSWNQVIMPNGKILYIDATWYGNCYYNHPTIPPVSDYYSPWFITYDKTFFEQGAKGTIRMHGAWSDARRIEDGTAGIENGTKNESLCVHTFVSGFCTMGSEREPAPGEVGKKPANSRGLHDMHGNVSEFRVARGGGCSLNAPHLGDLRSARRSLPFPSIQSISRGFRVVRN